MRQKLAGILDKMYGADTYYNAAMFEGKMREDNQ
jgi:hypothetical protein